jgi:hypothetical protein
MPIGEIVMWPFKKNKIKNIKPIDHKWSISQVQNEEGAFIIRLNETAKEWAKNPRLNVRVGFSFPLLGVEGNVSFDEVEDRIDELMTKTGASIQVLAINTDTFKEFVFYTENASGIEKVHKQAIQEFPEFDVQCYGESDPEWQGYFQWQKA